MPKVHVYIRSADWERLSQDGTDPAAWTRKLVADAVGRRLETPAAKAVDTASAKLPNCERRNPMVPAEKCTLVEGHLGSHSWVRT